MGDSGGGTLHWAFEFLCKEGESEVIAKILIQPIALTSKATRIMTITGKSLKMKHKYITLHSCNDRRLVFVPRILCGSGLCKHAAE